ncbi:MAG: hypothetical protein SGPRY_002016, partial [Prymnesium sp.]
MIDFALAVGSNGRVDAPDIKHPKRVTGLPVPVREMHATLVWRDQHELLNQPATTQLKMAEFVAGSGPCWDKRPRTKARSMSFVRGVLHATAKSLRIDAMKLELRLLQCVLESWEVRCHDFCGLDQGKPSFKDQGVRRATHDQFINSQPRIAL